MPASGARARSGHLWREDCPMRISPFIVLAFFAAGLMPAIASAQRVPFFSGAGTAVDPEIGVVNSGEILDAQVVVSGDLKHVTINARASSSELLALRSFTFVGAGERGRQGLVGGAGGGGRGAGGANGAPPRRDRRGGDADQDQSPADQEDGAPPASGSAGVLDRPGMTLLARFRD